MPIHVDHVSRRREVVEATLAVLAEEGPRALTIRSVAARLGGSSTLVTHYFPTRQALLDELIDGYVASWKEEIAALDSRSGDPRTRLRDFLRWMLPLDAQSQMEERGRINLLGERDTLLRTSHVFDSWDREVRALMERHVVELVDPDQVQLVVDVLRVTTNGITLSWVEHPDQWTEERQMAVIDAVLESLGFTAGREHSP